METYRYKALTKEGVETAGVVDATGFDDAIQRLLALDLREIQVFRAQGDRGEIPDAEVVPVRLKPNEALDFSQQVAQVSMANVPLSAGLRAAAEESTNRRVAAALVWVAELVDQGRPLQDALTESGRLLPPHVAGLIQASARTGNMGEALYELIELQEQTRSLRREILGTYLYPTFVVALSTLLVFGMSYFLASAIKDLFEEFQLELPLITRVLLWWRDVGIWIFGGGLLCFGTLLLLYRIVCGAARWGQLLATVPLLGSIWHWLSVAEWAGLMALLIHHNVPMPEALRWAGRGARDAYLGQTSQRMADGVARGRTLSQMMYTLGYIPLSLIPVIEWGERAGNAASSFRTGQQMLAERVRMRAILLQFIITPLVFLLVASVVLFVISALFAPLLNLISQLS